MVDLSLGIHTWFMVIPFGIFLPLGIVVSRWRSSNQGPKTIRQKWLDIHVLLNTTSSVCIFFSFVIGYFNLGTQTYKVHRNLGIFSACLVIIQPLNGWFRAKKKTDRDILDSTFFGNPKRWAWEKFHYTSGGCLVLSGWINCIIGVYIGPFNSLWILLSLIPASFALLWFVLLCRFPGKYTRLESVKLEDNERVEILASSKHKNSEEFLLKNNPMGNGTPLTI